MERAWRKARKIRDKLDATDDLTESIWRKPKGMHWKTYNRLTMQERQVLDFVDKKIQFLLDY